MRVDTTERQTSQRVKEKPILTHTANHVVVNYSDEEPEHLPRTNDNEVAQAEWWRWRCLRRTSEQYPTTR